ncbi:Uncharacterized membrane protein [Tranquillimonas rosea]|uniref:Uncharacterized membrane protein n=1 Tax=Tranquillimonas rosea TaxID=641238 RepID=A0A1H9WCP3_9RHOB|nr:DUF2177 family protein [Tranquillimonas rosea]SES31569.1 Uncharacterized membrane protein [Tranquillimonas rosea]
MQVIVLYISTAVVFLAADAVMLRTVMKPLFEAQLGDAVLDSPRMAPAAVFYMFYVAGLLWLVSWPALRADAPMQALLNGALLGALAYGTYEFTSFAVMRDWSWKQVVIDGLWGTALTGVSAWAGVMIARAVG